MWKAASEMYDRLSPQSVIRLQDNLAAAPVIINVGTACSGTDMVIFILQLLSELWLQRYNIRITFNHLWSCDVKKASRDFVDAVFKPPKIYLGAADLVKPENKVPKVDIFAASFECDNYSTLNVNRGGQGSLEARRGSSGESGDDVLEFIIATRPPVFITENVIGIAKKKEGTISDLGLVTLILDSVGYDCIDVVMKAFSEKKWLLCLSPIWSSTVAARSQIGRGTQELAAPRAHLHHFVPSSPQLGPARPDVDSRRYS